MIYIINFKIKDSQLCLVKRFIGIAMYVLAIGFWLIHAFTPHHHHGSFIAIEQQGIDHITTAEHNPLHDWLEVDLGSNHLNLGLRKSAEHNFCIPPYSHFISINEATPSLLKVEKSFSPRSSRPAFVKSRFKNPQPGRVPVGHSPPLV